jgi:hypothetical protein
VRFYRSSPYLLVTQTSADGACIASVVYYRDLSEEYIIIPHRGIGTLTFNPTLSEGWNLVAFSGSVDSKVPETISAIASLMTAATTAAGVKALPPEATENQLVIEPSAEPLAPGLYQIKFVAQSIPTFTPVIRVRQSGGKGSPMPCRTLAGPPQKPPEGPGAGGPGGSKP